MIRSDGTTVLGGDDKAGIAAILEAVRAVREHKVPHGPLELVFTICEEIGLVGAKHLDVGRLRARRGLVLDCDGVNELITRAPAANRMQVTVHGLEAHAGLCPEQGISAIRVAGTSRRMTVACSERTRSAARRRATRRLESPWLWKNGMALSGSTPVGSTAISGK